MPEELHQEILSYGVPDLLQDLDPSQAAQPAEAWSKRIKAHLIAGCRAALFALTQSG
jgi:hypothetical protein